jgi:hypothetical protein
MDNQYYPQQDPNHPAYDPNFRPPKLRDIVMTQPVEQPQTSRLSDLMEWFATPRRHQTNIPTHTLGTRG